MKKRLIIITATAVAALGAGGAVWATAANAADVSGAERDRVANAATTAVGGGTAVDVETSDDQGEAFEVEVRKADGSEVDVALDKDLKVITQDAEDAEDAGDRALTPAERTAAEQAAVGAVPGGTVTDVEAGDDAGVAYEVEVRGTDNAEWDVELDAAYKVLSKAADN
jgi:uncharacterized membrane protein YkoI